MAKTIGYYKKGEQYVVIKDIKGAQELRLLGNFGNNLEHAKNKDPNRVGPIDKSLIKSIEQEQERPECLLALSEAFYLAQVLGVLSVIVNGDKEPTSLDKLWTEFRGSFIATNRNFEFAVDYAIYHHFRCKGWVVKSGENYGANYLLYRKGPPVDHSQYAILIVCDDNEAEQLGSSNYNWQSMFTFHRVLQSVNKEMVVASVSSNGMGVDMSKPINASDLVVTLSKFSNRSQFRVQ